MRAKQVAELCSSPNRVLYSALFETLTLHNDFSLLPLATYITGNEQDESANSQFGPVVPVFEKFVGSGLDVSRGKLLVTLALTYIIASILSQRSNQVDSLLPLSTAAVDIAMEYIAICIEQIAAKILENVLIEFVEWRRLTNAYVRRKVNWLLWRIGGGRCCHQG